MTIVERVIDAVTIRAAVGTAPFEWLGITGFCDLGDDIGRFFSSLFEKKRENLE